jgi:hypothetical protein
MWIVGPVGFAAPLLLLGLIALPILWLILRAVPPAPIRRRFPGVALLLGLKDDESETDKTPWWLLMLRMAAIGAAVIAFAGPVLNPDRAGPGTGPLVVMVDGGWADARDWPRRVERMGQLLDEAGRAGRPVAVIRLTDAPAEVPMQAAAAWAPQVAAMAPQAWSPDPGGWVARLPEGDFDTYWLSDGLDHPGRGALVDALMARGDLTVFESPRQIVALRPARFGDGALKLGVERLPATGTAEYSVSARGPDPAGIERELAAAPVVFAMGVGRAEVALEVPPELRNRITRFEIAGVRSAGAVSLTDDTLKRRKVALISGARGAEGLQLLAPTHYLRQALQPVADIIDGTISDVVLAAPDVIVLADVAQLAAGEDAALRGWVEKGGLLLRFAGARLAASEVSRGEEDALMPVRLREGGRTVGGAMSWGDPKTLAPFREGTPFFGLAVPGEVAVTAQVLAQPDPTLAERTIAALADGTPLVTRKELGQGQVVLFHVTANAEWSTLPLSGLFVGMLERLAVSARAALPGAAELEGQVFVPQVALDAFGALGDAGDRPGVQGSDLAAAMATGPAAALPPGLYAGEERRVALNAVGADTPLAAAAWPPGVAREGLEAPVEQSLKGLLLAVALGLLLADVLAALAVSGRLARGMAAALALALLPFVAGGVPAQAQDAAAEAEAAPAPPLDPAAEARAVEATSEVRLAHVLTGDAELDRVTEAGLLGLSLRLYERTTVEPSSPIGVDIERDELLFFPVLYWPVSAAQALPSDAAYARLNRYLRTGGMIVFDTRDGDLSGTGGTPEGRRLQQIAAGLDIPPLEPVPPDHVLTRSFYLLQDFPGRFTGAPVWVEAAPADAEQAEGMPFRNLNDGVTPVVIGGSDWASAWAVDDYGAPMFPVGRGFGGERQREIATRFGINLVMHVLTGNYKSDQVHVPALLERLGQ